MLREVSEISETEQKSRKKVIQKKSKMLGSGEDAPDGRSAELLRLLSDVAALMEAGVAAKARELAAVRGEGERLVF